MLYNIKYQENLKNFEKFSQIYIIFLKEVQNYGKKFSLRLKFSGAHYFQQATQKIVDDWTKVSGEKPSWYYYTAFSDWAEWYGRDIGNNDIIDIKI